MRRIKTGVAGGRSPWQLSKNIVSLANIALPQKTEQPKDGKNYSIS
ncbi:hypothetical protein [Mucilaginibacter sp. RCC_168]